MTLLGLDHWIQTGPLGDPIEQPDGLDDSCPSEDPTCGNPDLCPDCQLRARRGEL